MRRLLDLMWSALHRRAELESLRVGCLLRLKCWRSYRVVMWFCGVSVVERKRDSLISSVDVEAQSPVWTFCLVWVHICSFIGSVTFTVRDLHVKGFLWSLNAVRNRKHFVSGLRQSFLEAGYRKEMLHLISSHALWLFPTWASGWLHPVDTRLNLFGSDSLSFQIIAAAGTSGRPRTFKKVVCTIHSIRFIPMISVTFIPSDPFALLRD